jgi:hypothetical protein
VAGLADPGSSLPGGARRTVAWAGTLSLLAGAFLVTGTVAANRPTPGAVEAARLPTPPSRRALVFVHGSWSSRVAARLAAAGMRRDSIETALRRNALCAVDRYARWREDPSGGPPALDVEPLPGVPVRLEPRLLSPGNVALVDTLSAADAACRREAAADRLGVFELEPLLWRAPPLEGEELVVARDLGPEANAAVRAAFPAHDAWMLVAGPENGAARVTSYEEGVALLWGASGTAGLTR